ncbi:MAG: MltA domain-containing protein [Planctomycetes bacterium]|nr:MltA domain-containing protein [Planctomycetota bacterium]
MIRSRWALSLLALPLALLSVSCTTRYQPPKEPEKDYARPLPDGAVALEKLTDPALYPDFAPGFEDRESLLHAIDQSLSYFKHKSSQKYFPYLDVTHERCLRSLHSFRALLASVGSGTELNDRIRADYDVYRSVGWDGSGTVLFTGYCTPIYKGSVTRTETYRYPLYRRPKDLVSQPDGTPLGRKTETGTVPYFTRAEIEDGRLLAGKGLELVYLADPLEVYIIHVQGSARIQVADGRELRVGYAGKTDKPYKSIGMALIQDGKFAKQELSLTRIKRYFHEHPEDLSKYLQQNESYVFFTENKGGPFGSLGVPVTTRRSIATDKQVYPRGNLAFVETTVPVLGGGGEIVPQPFHRFLLDQDTGGAIRSAGRADLYLGVGPDAELLAGHTTYEGRFYYVFLKDLGRAEGGGGREAEGGRRREGGGGREAEGGRRREGGGGRRPGEKPGRGSIPGMVHIGPIRGHTRGRYIEGRGTALPCPRCEASSAAVRNVVGTFNPARKPDPVPRGHRSRRLSLPQEAGLHAC